MNDSMLLTEEKLENILYSINKHAKIYRDKESKARSERYSVNDEARSLREALIEPIDCNHWYDEYRYDHCYDCHMDYYDRMSMTSLPDDVVDDLEKRYEKAYKEEEQLRDKKDRLYSYKDDLLYRFLEPLCCHIADGYIDRWGMHHPNHFIYYKTANRSFHFPDEGFSDLVDIPIGSLETTSEHSGELITEDEIDSIMESIKYYAFEGCANSDYPGDSVFVDEFVKKLTDEVIERAWSSGILDDVLTDDDEIDIEDTISDWTYEYCYKIDPEEIANTIVDSMDDFKQFREWRMSGPDSNMFSSYAEALLIGAFDDMELYNSFNETINKELERRVIETSNREN